MIAPNKTSLLLSLLLLFLLLLLLLLCTISKAIKIQICTLSVCEQHTWSWGLPMESPHLRAFHLHRWSMSVAATAFWLRFSPWRRPLFVFLLPVYQFVSLPGCPWQWCIWNKGTRQWLFFLAQSNKITIITKKYVSNVFLINFKHKIMWSAYMWEFTVIFLVTNQHLQSTV